MSVPAVPAGPHAASHDQSASGRAFGIWSLAMVPMLVVTFLPSFALQAWILSWKGLEGSEPMSQQGAVGWLAFALGVAVFLVPQAVGVYLGARARRLGAARLGVAGMAFNAVLFVGLTVALLVTQLAQ